MLRGANLSLTLTYQMPLLIHYFALSVHILVLVIYMQQTVGLHVYKFLLVY